MKKLLITTILVLSCAECFSQDNSVESLRDVDRTVQDVLANHSIWFNKKWEFDVTNSALNSTRDQYHVVVKTGSSCKSRQLAPKPQKFMHGYSAYMFQPSLEVWIPATVQVSPHNNPTTYTNFSLMMKSAISRKKSTQVLYGHLHGVKEFGYETLSVIFNGGNQTVTPTFRYRYFPPSGKTRLRDNVDLSSTWGVGTREIAW